MPLPLLQPRVYPLTREVSNRALTTGHGRAFKGGRGGSPFAMELSKDGLKRFACSIH
jgi:hypothetical protein